MSQETIERKQEKSEVSYSVVNFRWFRRKNTPYIFAWIFYYTWIVAFATWWTASPLSENVYSTQIRELMHIVTLISSAVFVFIIRTEWFVKVVRIGSILIITCMIVFFIIPNTYIHILSAIISSIAMGCVNISIFIPFVFSLNNTEKLYAIVGSNALIQAVSLFVEYNVYRTSELILSFIILIISLSAIMFFNRQDVPENTNKLDQNQPKFNQRIYLSLLFNCAIVILCKGVGKGIINIATEGIGSSVLTWYYIGGFAGCLIYMLVYAFTKKAYIWLGNITFSSVSLALMFNAFVHHISEFVVPFAILMGLGSTIGMINMYYIISVIGKKYDSMLYIRVSILFIGVFAGVSGIAVGNIISRVGTFEISILASILSTVIMIAFMFVSPIMERAEYVNDWGFDSQHSEIDNEQLYFFLKYRFSKREIDVCKLLLQGYTMRQISGILSIAYPTVNTYCTSIYRKTKINSRTELMNVFKDYTNR